MSASFTGGCVCGAIRYEVTGKPIMMFNCHCRDCQRTTGSGFTPVVYVPAKAFKITKGSPRYYSTPSEMVAHNKRGFCPECGSTVHYSGGNFPDVIAIPLGALDDPYIVDSPDFSVWERRRHDWLEIIDEDVEHSD